MKTQLDRWYEKLCESQARPAYQMIADIISAEVDQGSLSAKDRLPPLRDLAQALHLNYTTVARGYAEARRRGLIDSKPGMGTFVKGKAPALPLSGGSSFEMTMNLPTEPYNQVLLQKVRQAAVELMRDCDFYDLFRYQDFGGSEKDKEAGLLWLKQFLPAPDINSLLVCPGIHSALVGLLSLFGNSGAICVPNLVYPGLKAIAAQLGVKLQAVVCDSDGPKVRSFEELCKSGGVSALYLNPTIQNPSTLSVPMHRRSALADVALRYSIPIIEDEAYAALPSKKLPAMAELAPELTYYITGFSKCFGAGLRVAYVQAPNKRMAQRLAGAMRALNVMASPITNALATTWINDGTANYMLKAIRAEARERQAQASKILHGFDFRTHECGFHLWLNLPEGNDWNPANVAAHLRSFGVGAVSSAAFCTDNSPPNAIRLCLGGSSDRNQCVEALLQVADILEHPRHLTTVVL